MPRRSPLVHAYTLPTPELPSMRLPALVPSAAERIEIVDRDYAVIVAEVLGAPTRCSLTDPDTSTLALARLAGSRLSARC